MADDGPKLFARLSDEAHDGWRQATRVYGGSMTSMAEAIGLALCDLDGPRSKLPKVWRDLFVEAERLEELRRKSQGRRS